MVSIERRQLYVKHYQEILGITDWRIGFQKVSPRQVCDQQIRSNKKLVALSIEDEKKKEALILHTSQILTKSDIAHELVHLAHPEWSNHALVVEETQRIVTLK